MLAARDAGVALVATVALVPWEVLVYAGDLGWGVTFLYSRYIASVYGSDVLAPLRLVEIYRSLGASGTTGLAVTVAWLAAAVMVGWAALFVSVRRVTVGDVTDRQERRVGVVLVAAGALFVASRVVGTVSLAWLSLPVGALYALGVGGLLYRNGVDEG